MPLHALHRRTLSAVARLPSSPPVRRVGSNGLQSAEALGGRELRPRFVRWDTFCMESWPEQNYIPGTEAWLGKNKHIPDIVHVLLIQKFQTNKNKFIQFQIIKKNHNFKFEGNDFFTIEFHNNFEVKPTWTRTILGWAIFFSRFKVFGRTTQRLISFNIKKENNLVWWYVAHLITCNLFNQVTLRILILMQNILFYGMWFILHIFHNNWYLHDYFT